MKKLTKWLTSLFFISLALTMFAGTAFAEDTAVPADAAVVKVTKTADGVDSIKLTDDDTYKFKIESKHFAAINDGFATPTIDNITSGVPDNITLKGNLSDGGLNGSFAQMTFDMPGIYTFEVSEVSTSNKNLAVDNSIYTVRVYVVYQTTAEGVPTSELQASMTIVKGGNNSVGDGDIDGEPNPAKVDVCAFDNQLDTNTKDLTVTKTVTGNTGSTTKDFTFTVDLYNTTGQYEIEYTGGTEGTYPTLTNASVETVITLRHGQSFTIKGLPAGARYRITEAGSAGYTAQVNNSTTHGVGDSVTVGSTVSYMTTVNFTNNSTMTPPTAFVVNNWPYLLLGVFAAAGIAFFVVRKKKNVNKSF